MELQHLLEKRSTKSKVDTSQDIVFQTISWHGEDVDFRDIIGEEKKNIDCNQYVIKAFGSTTNGDTVSVSIKNFAPFFYIRVKNNDTFPLHAVASQIKDFLVESLHKNTKNTILAVEPVYRKDFWGFSNYKKFEFLKLSFANHRTFRNISYLLSKPCDIHRVGKGIEFKCYESNIDPYIRLMHINNIDPTGWVCIPKGTYQKSSDDILPSICQIDISCDYKNVQKYECDTSAPFMVASFDLECMSLTGDFPMPKKTYKKLASDLYELYSRAITHNSTNEKLQKIQDAIMYAFNLDDTFAHPAYIHKVDPKSPYTTVPKIASLVNSRVDQIHTALSTKAPDGSGMSVRDDIIGAITKIFAQMQLPELKGDQIIQIGTTFHAYGDKQVREKCILTLGTCEPVEGVHVESFESEASMILRWRDIIQLSNPDIITGFNIFGFDFSYIYERSKELGIDNEFMKINRFEHRSSVYKEVALSSSAMGDNLLKLIPMDGRVLIDIMKVVQRDHKLDSYKLDNIAKHFMGMQKNDVSPQRIFALHKGTSVDRAEIAAYCVQDCVLCNNLMIKLEIIANNMGMSNVCSVPLSFIFMRGQGIKIFSLVLKQCMQDGFVIPVVRPPSDKEKEMPDYVEDDEGYEGAIVLDPEEGIYIDEPVAVLDYASLYPSSMISENLSHCSIVLDEKYDNLPNVDYLDIPYDVYEGKGDKKQKIGIKTNRFVQPVNGEKGVIPTILKKLLTARKTTRKKIEMMTVTFKGGNNEMRGFFNKETNTLTTPEGASHIIDMTTSTLTDTFNDFQKAILDGLQNAFKVTANSLYGQMGASTSPVYLKDIAASTTATGRKMIMMGKAFMEKNYGAKIVYGDTDSLMIIFPHDKNQSLENMTPAQIGHSRIMPSINIAKKASAEFRKTIKAPHDLEYEKTFWPFVLLSKKRYIGNMYEQNDKKFKQKSMGVVLKRRDNAPIVKHIYGGIIDIILEKQDVKESVDFLLSNLDDLVNGKVELDNLVITKSLRADYADPTRIAHKVLANRMGDRDPGNMPQTNDRIKYAYISVKKQDCLQGERIEDPEFITKNSLKLDYDFYITNQIMKPILQVYGIVVSQLDPKKTPEYYKGEYEKFLRETRDPKKAREKLISQREKDAKEILFDPILRKLTNAKNGTREITEYFKIDNKFEGCEFLDKQEKHMFNAGDTADIIRFAKKKEKEKKAAAKKIQDALTVKTEGVKTVKAVKAPVKAVKTVKTVAKTPVKIVKQVIKTIEKPIEDLPKDEPKNEVPKEINDETKSPKISMASFNNMFSSENAKKELEKDKLKKEKLTKGRATKALKKFELMDCRKISDYIEKLAKPII